MVWVKRLQSQGMRNLSSLDVSLSSGCNLVEGSNGSGKTSLLEALYLLSRGRSFRTGDIRRVIADGADHVTVSSLIDVDSQEHRLGLEKYSKQTRIRIDGTEVSSMSQLASFLPVRFIGPEVQQLVSGLPTIRRSFMDWGLFHVKPQSHDLMRRFRKTLKQRNAALVNGLGRDVVFSLDQIFCDYADQLNNLRKEHVANVYKYLPEQIIEILDVKDVQLNVREGIPQGQNLAEQLTTRYAKDRDHGFTSIGPHRGDLMIRVDDRSGKGRLSRGQEKLVSIALLIAQANAMKAECGNRSVFLLDDIASELDKDSQVSVIDSLSQLTMQCIYTSLPDQLTTLAQKVEQRFHVKHGAVEPH